MYERVERLRLTHNTNLWSYLMLKGCYLMFEEYRSNRKSHEEERRLLEGMCTNFRPNLDLVKEYLNAVKDALLSNGYRVKFCKVRAASRIIVGVSESFGQIPFEFGLFFDPMINLPYIPGSTIKGALRSALWETAYRDAIGEGKDVGEAKAMAEDEVNYVFGSEGNVSVIGITDAYPISLNEKGHLLEPDVITAHYPSARSELDVKPNPVPFITVAPGVEFAFYLFFNREVYERKVETISDLKKPLSHRSIHVGGELSEELKSVDKGSWSKVLPLIDRALIYTFSKGVGAKISTGYSRFVLVEYRSELR